MPRIANIGIADWSGRNVFTLAENTADLELERGLAFDDLLNEAHENLCKPILGHPLLDRIQYIEKELAENRLTLAIKVTFNQEVDPSTLPPSCTCIPSSYPCYAWETKAYSDNYVWGDHPLFWIIPGLTEMTRHEVKVSLNKKGMKTALIVFHLSEDIKNPTRFLLALCKKMARWGAPTS